MLKLNSGEKLRYWKWWKAENCRELIDKQNCEAIFRIDAEAMVKRQEEWSKQFRLPDEYYKNG